MDSQTKSADRLVASLEKQTRRRVWQPTSDQASAYRPDTITGELLKVEEWQTENGPTRVAVLLDDLDGDETSIFLGSTALTNAWDEQEPCVGDRVGIRFGGQVEGKNGRTYNRFYLAVERHNAPPPLRDAQEDLFAEPSKGGKK